MRQEIRFCRSEDGVRIAYATSGSGPPLLYAANWLTHLKLDWQSPLASHWFRELSRNHTLVRYDARGNGLSDRVVNNLSVDAWAQDLAAVADDLGLQRFPVLGFCQGGATAVTFAARHPERVSRLILYDSFAQGAFVEGSGAQEKRKAEALAEMIAVGWGQDAAFRELFANLLVPDAAKAHLRWLGELQRKTVSPETAARLWRAFHHIDVRELARQVQAPSLIFHVEGDKMVPFEGGRQLASLIPDGRFVPLEGRNHILLEEDAAWSRFLAEIDDFLGSSMSDRDRAAMDEVLAALTPREREVLQHVARGLSNSEIATRLVISPKTVRNHVSRIYRKLQVDSRAQAILLAQQADLDRTAS